MSKPDAEFKPDQVKIFAKNIKRHVGAGTAISSAQIAKEWFNVKIGDLKKTAFVRAIVHEIRVHYEIYTKDKKTGVETLRVLCANDNGYFLARNSYEGMEYVMFFTRRNLSQDEARREVLVGVELMREVEKERRK